MFFKEPVIFPYAQYKKIIFTFLLYFHWWRTNVYIIFRYSPPAWLYTSSFIQRAYSYLPKKKSFSVTHETGVTPVDCLGTQNLPQVTLDYGLCFSIADSPDCRHLCSRDSSDFPDQGILHTWRVPPCTMLMGQHFLSIVNS